MALTQTQTHTPLVPLQSVVDDPDAIPRSPTGCACFAHNTRTASLHAHRNARVYACSRSPLNLIARDCATNSTQHRGNVFATSAPDLIAQHATDDSTAHDA